MHNVVKFPGTPKITTELVDRMERGQGISEHAISNFITDKLMETMAEAQKHFPIGIPKETIINAMENAKEGERFSMDVLIENNLDPEARAKADAARIQKKLEAKQRF